MQTICIFDPTRNDPASAVRGIGRYVSGLHEALPHARIVSTLSGCSDVLIHPYIGFHTQPAITRRYAKRQIGIIHDIIPQRYPAAFPVGIRGHFMTAWNRYCLRLYDEFITNSHTTKKSLITYLHIPAEKIHVAYPPVTYEITRAHPEPPTKTIPNNYLLYVGDATWNKNVAALAQAVKETQYTLVIAGKVFTAELQDHPWNRELNECMGHTNNNPQFITLGYVSDNQLAWLYQNTALHLLLSRDEGFGFSYIEASYFGTPSLLSDIPVFREVSGGNAFFTPLASINGSAIRRAVTDPDVRDMGMRAQKWCKKYSVDTFSHAIQKICNE